MLEPVFEIAEIVAREPLPNIEDAKACFRAMNRERMMLRGLGHTAAEFALCQAMMSTFMFCLEDVDCQAFGEDEIPRILRYLGNSSWYAAKTLDLMIRAPISSLSSSDPKLTLSGHPEYPLTIVWSMGDETPFSFVPFLHALGRLSYQYANFAIETCGVAKSPVILLRALGLRYVGEFEDCYTELRRYYEMKNGAIDQETAQLMDHVRRFELHRNSTFVPFNFKRTGTVNCDESIMSVPMFNTHDPSVQLARRQGGLGFVVLPSEEELRRRERVLMSRDNPSVYGMSEDEQLAAAIALSLRDQTQSDDYVEEEGEGTTVLRPTREEMILIDDPHRADVIERLRREEEEEIDNMLRAEHAMHRARRVRGHQALRGRRRRGVLEDDDYDDDEEEEERGRRRNDDYDTIDSLHEFEMLDMMKQEIPFGLGRSPLMNPIMEIERMSPPLMGWAPIPPTEEELLQEAIRRSIEDQTENKKKKKKKKKNKGMGMGAEAEAEDETEEEGEQEEEEEEEEGEDCLREREEKGEQEEEEEEEEEEVPVVVRKKKKRNGRLGFGLFKRKNRRGSNSPEEDENEDPVIVN